VLIYELELISTEAPTATAMAQYHGGRLGHSPDEDFLPPFNSTPGVQAAPGQNPQAHASPELILPAAPEK
jgi:hypothetical protein